jgi:hypothetical protein
MVGDKHDEQKHGGAEMPGRSGMPSSSPRQPLPVLPVVGRGGPAQHCWEIVQSPDNDLQGNCEECYAYFVQRDCWTMWALRDAGHKPCCQKLDDCARCPVLLHQVAPTPQETVEVRAQTPAKPPVMHSGRTKQVCRYLDVIDVPVPPESEHYLSAVSRAVQARSSTFRCRLRGVHLDVGYVGDMCVSRHVQDCVFLEEAHPELTVQAPSQPEETEKMPPLDDETDVPTESVGDRR